MKNFFITTVIFLWCAAFLSLQAQDCDAPPAPSVNWSGCDKSGINLEAEDLSGANLNYAILNGANLSGANLSGANLVYTNLVGANLTGTNVTGANMVGAHFDNADLSNLNLTGMNLLSATMAGANLSGANLNSTELSSTDMSGAILTGAILTGAQVTSSNLAGANLSGANLSGIGIYGNNASLYNSDLTGANLTGADLTNMDLRNINVSGADLTGAILTGVWSGGIKGTPYALPTGWQLINGYLVGPLTVTFDANGGTTPSPTTINVLYNATYGTLATASRPCYAFNGWFTASNGGTEITSTSAVSITSNQTLYAQWTALNYNYTETIVACGSYEWHGTTYTSSNNTATWTGTNAAGCDSIVTLNLTINPLPVVSVGSNPANVCVGGTSQLIAVVAGTIEAPTYCTSYLTGGNTCGYANLTHVSIDGTTLNNNSLCNYTQEFGNYIAYAATGSTTAALVLGQTYTISVSTEGAAIVSMFIDYNHNGQFEPVEWTQVYTDATAGTASFTVPSNATLGATGMRVRSRVFYSPNGAEDACSIFGSGSTDDYIITIINPNLYSFNWVGSPATHVSNSTVYNPVATLTSSSDTYTVTVSKLASGCTSTGSVTIQNIPVSAVSLTVGGANSCVGTQTVSAAPTGGVAPLTYSWTEDGVAFGTNAATVTASAGTHLYACTVTDNCGSSASSSLSATTYSIASITPTTVRLCGGNPAIATVGPAGATYSWSGGLGNAQTANITTSGTYSVTVTQGNCVSTATASAIVTSLPTITASSNSPVCEGSALNLTSTGVVTQTVVGNYSVESIAYAPVTPASAASAGPAGDEVVSGAIPIGFNFTYYGITYTNVYVSTNGFISFDPYTFAGCCSGQFLPNGNYPNAVIALNWMDLDTGKGGTIDYFNLANPNRFVVRFNNVATYENSGTVSGEIILYPSGSIEIHNSAITTTGSNQTQGIENSTGTLATTVAGRNSAAWNATADAFRFSPPVPAVTYAWTGPNAFSVQNPSIASASTTDSGTYTVTFTDPFGCSASTTVDAVVNPTSFTEPIVACGSYEWHGNTYTSSNNTATWTGTNAAGCDSIVTLNLTINQPSYSTEPIVACGSYEWHGNTYTSSNNTATWTGTNAAGCDCIVTLNLTINQPSYSTEPIVACGSYDWHGNTYTSSNNTATWTGTNAAGCDSIVTLHLTINPLPTPAISGSLALCAGGSTTLDAGEGYASYLWSTTAVTQTISANTADSYTVTVTDANGCTGSTTTTVTVNPLPVVSVTATPANLCVGGTSQLIAIIGGTLEAVPAYCTSNLSNNGNSCGYANLTHVSIDGTTLNNNSVCNYTPGIGTYTAYAATGSTTAVLAPGQTYTISVSTVEAAIVSMFIDYNHNGQFEPVEWTQAFTDANAGTASFTVPSNASLGATGMRVRSRVLGTSNGAADACSTFYSGSTDDYIITIMDTSLYSFNWVGSPATHVSNAASYNPVATLTSSSDTYTVTVSELASGCTSTGSVTIQNIPVSTVSLTVGGANSCVGTQTVSAAQIGGLAPFTYSWTEDGVAFGTNTAIVTASAGTHLYACTVTDYCGSSASSSLSATTYSTASITPTSVVLCGGNPAIATASPAGATYSWSGGLGNAQTATLSASGEYTVTVTQGTCVTSATASARVTSSPTITASSNSPVCEGGTLNLTSTGVVTQPVVGNYSVESIAYAPVSPETAASAGPAGDDVLSGAIPIGFNFTYYGSTYTNVYVSTNGFISFNPSDSFVPQALPNAINPNAVIALDWMDLNTGRGGTIDYFNLASPNRFVVRFNNVATYGSSGTVSGEIILYPSGSIEIHNSAITTTGSNQTQGIENSTGTLATTVPGRNNTAWNATADAFRFSPPVPAVTYAWTGPHAFSVQNPSIASASPTDSGTYTVTFTDPFGCTASTTVDALVNPASSSTEPIVACGSYEWHGNTYTSSNNTATWTGTNAAGCDSIVTLDLTINPLSTPAISGTLAFCAVGSTTLDAGAGYSSYLWSTGETTQTISVSSTTPVSVTVTNAAGCSATSASVTPTSNAVSTAPTSISSSVAFATSGTNFTLSVNGGSLGTGASWKWYTGSCGGTLIGTGASISVSQIANTTYFVRAEGTCNTTACATITVNSQCGATSITSSAGTTAVCAGSAVTLTPVGVLAPGAQWRWDDDCDAVPLTSDASATYTTASTFTVNPTSTTTYYLQSVGGACGVTACIPVTINVLAKPATPGTISGSASVCSSTSVTYTIAAVAGATSYTWTAPTNATLVSAQGGTSMTVSYASAFTSGTLKVKAINCSGSSSDKSLSVAKQTAPAAPASIAGSASVCPSTSVTYTIAAVTNATSYTWVAPANATLASAQGGTSMTINFGSAFVSGTLSVSAVGCGGTSAAKTLSITKLAVPATPGTISGAAAPCKNSTQTYSIAAVTGASSYTWALPTGVSFVAGSVQTGTSIQVVVASTFTSGTLSVKANNCAGSSANKTLALSGTAAPATPSTITGSTSVTQNSTNNAYSVTAVAGLTYNWSVPAGCTITLGQGTSAIKVTWGTVAGIVSVTSTNACGTSVASSKAVSVKRSEEADADAGITSARTEETVETVETLLTSTDALNAIAVYPNPTTGEARITFSATTSSKYSLNIVDLQGRVINSTSGAAIEGNNTLDINLSNCSNGVYMIHLMHNDTLQTLRVVKM